MDAFAGRIYLRLLDRTVKMRENNRAKKPSPKREKVLSIAKRMRGNATICISYKMQPTKSLLLEEKVGGFSRSDEV